MGETAVVALRSTAEEAMVKQELVRQMRVLAEAGVRTVQRAVRERRQQVRAAQVATVRFETGNEVDCSNW